MRTHSQYIQIVEIENGYLVIIPLHLDEFGVFDAQALQMVDEFQSDKELVKINRKERIKDLNKNRMKEQRTYYFSTSKEATSFIYERFENLDVDSEE